MAKPKIRFKGYTDDWEQRKLGELYSILTERNTDLLPYNRTLSVATMTYKTDGNGAADSSLANYKRLRIGDIAFEGHTSKEFRYGRFVLNDAGDGIMSPRFSALRPHTQMPTTFWKYYIHYEPIMRKVLVNSTKAGTMMNELVVDEFLKSSLYVPSKEEQACIGGYFTTLDHLITLHQCKCHLLFKLLHNDWEQRKLNEIADKVSEKNKNNEFSEPFTNSAEQGIISQKDYFDREIVNDENLNGYYIVRNDDFIYNPRISVTAPVGPINRNRLGRNGVISPLYTVFRTHDIDNLYLEFYFKTTKWHRFMKLNGDSGARFDRFTISSTQFMEMPIPYPTLEEQRKIGVYFESLDTLITLHQRKNIYF